MFSGKKLRELREARGLTQEDLSQLSKVGRRQISFYETGKAMPHPKSLSKLMKALNVTPDALFFGCDVHNDEHPQAV